MPQEEKSHLQDVVILTQAVESVFRKLIRFLIGRISLVNLLEIIRTIFVEEAESELRRKNTDRNVSLTQLALLSGLDTRTLVKIRNGQSYRKPFHEAATFLKQVTPGVAILDSWSSKPPYFDSKKGEPAQLKLIGDGPSFESLFSECVKSRGITPTSLLHQLVESGSVTVDESNGTISLRRLSYLPLPLSAQPDSIAVGFAAIGNLIDTVVHNLSSENCDLLYQRGSWTYRLPMRNQESVRIELRELLETAYKTAQKVLAKYEVQDEGLDQITSGFGLFYFEEPKQKWNSSSNTKEPKNDPEPNGVPGRI